MRILAIVLTVLFVLCVGPVTRAEAREGSVEEGQRIVSVISGLGNFRLVEARSNSYTLGLDDDSGRPAGFVYLGLDEADHVPRFRSRSFTIEIGNVAPSPTIIDTLVSAARTIAEWDGGGEGDQEVRLRTEPLGELIDWTSDVLIVAILLGLLRRGRVSVDVRLPHVLQVIAQSSIFFYWLFYWPGVRNHLPAMALQFVLAYAADAAFCFARFGSWRIGLSQLPIVLSINLFEWLDWRGAVIAILVAFGTKAFLHRGGRHIFNPSVAGLTVVGIITLVAPDFIHFSSVFHTLNIPPNMAEWILLAALLPQTRFRVLPVSIGAMLALWSTGNPALVRPAIILAFTLLASDPATTPRTDLGKILFGAVVGFGLPMFSIVMRRLGQPDDFAKVFPVAVANALAPSLELLAGSIILLAARFGTGAESFIATRWAALSPNLDRLGSLVRRPLPNYAFVVSWLLICTPLLMEEKQRDFEPAFHWNWGTPLVVRAADDVPRCTNNPVFCTPFTFVQEVALWRERAFASAQPPASSARDVPSAEGRPPRASQRQEYGYGFAVAGEHRSATKVAGLNRSPPGLD